MEPPSKFENSARIERLVGDVAALPAAQVTSLDSRRLSFDRLVERARTLILLGPWRLVGITGDSGAHKSKLCAMPADAE
jgi:hypothetical protein